MVAPTAVTHHKHERQQPHREARIGETGAQALPLKPDVRVLVSDDPRGHRPHHRIGSLAARPP